MKAEDEKISLVMEYKTNDRIDRFAVEQMRFEPHPLAQRGVSGLSMQPGTVLLAVFDQCSRQSAIHRGRIGRIRWEVIKNGNGSQFGSEYSGKVNRLRQCAARFGRSVGDGDFLKHDLPP